jgi:hypothetical protein
MTVRVAQSLDRGKQPASLEHALGWVNAKKHDARHWPCLAKDQVAKILVFGQEQPVFASGKIEYLRIGRMRRDIRDVDDVVLGLPQQCNQSCVHALVNQPAHRLAANENFVG